MIATVRQFELTENKKNDVRARRHFEYLGTIVAAATLAPPGAEVETSVRCRRRLQKIRCNGLIHLRLHEKPVGLHWWCPECGDNGVIRNWKGVPWNIAHTGLSRSGEEYFELVLSHKEYELLKQIAVLASGAEKLISNAVSVTNGFLLVGFLDDFDILLGYIAFEANHEQKIRRQQALNKLFDKLNRIFEN